MRQRNLFQFLVNRIAFSTGKLRSKVRRLTDRLGPVFGPVKSDVGGNIDKLRKQCVLYPDVRTIQQLVLNERKHSTRIDPNGAASALLWYNRCKLCRF